jgi:hypothetical protein
MDGSYSHNGRLPVFGELRQDLGEVDGADRGAGSDCLHHLIGTVLVLQQS